MADTLSKLGILRGSKRQRDVPVAQSVLLPALLLRRSERLLLPRLPGRLRWTERPALAVARTVLGVGRSASSRFRGDRILLLLDSGLLVLANLLDLGCGRVSLVDEAVWDFDDTDPYQLHGAASRREGRQEEARTPAWPPGFFRSWPSLPRAGS